MERSDDESNVSRPLSADERARLHPAGDPAAADALLARLPAEIRPVLLLALLAEPRPEEFASALEIMRRHGPARETVGPEADELPAQLGDSLLPPPGAPGEPALTGPPIRAWLPAQPSDFAFAFGDQELGELFRRATGGDF